jgi:very-long-chain enoyl-CoA reductase
MPLKNLFINCGYYWVLYGLLCGYSLFNPNYEEWMKSPINRGILVFLFVSCELKNLKCHMILRKLKEDNNGEKGIPNGEGFEFVSCANYFWEILAWVFFSILVGLPAFYLFTACGFYILRKWSLKRHNDYKKIFGDRYPKDRKAFIPFLI